MFVRCFTTGRSSAKPQCLASGDRGERERMEPRTKGGNLEASSQPLDKRHGLKTVSHARKSPLVSSERKRACPRSWNASKLSAGQTHNTSTALQSSTFSSPANDPPQCLRHWQLLNRHCDNRLDRLSDVTNVANFGYSRTNDVWATAATRVQPLTRHQESKRMSTERSIVLMKTIKSKRPTRAQTTQQKRRTCPGCHVRRSPTWWPNPVSPVCLVCSWRVRWQPRLSCSRSDAACTPGRTLSPPHEFASGPPLTRRRASLVQPPTTTEESMWGARRYHHSHQAVGETQQCPNTQPMARRSPESPSAAHQRDRRLRAARLNHRQRVPA